MASRTTMLPCELHGVLQIIVNEYKDNKGEDDIKVVALKDRILESCTTHGYCKLREMHVKTMGIHPANRNRTGVHCIRAQTRLAVIKKSGFSWPAIKENLVGIEDNPATSAIERFTLKQCASRPEYAQYVAGEVKGGTLGAGHATHGFAQLHDRRPCTIPSISTGGYMDQEKCFRDEGIKNATLRGMRYKMLRWEVEHDFPVIPEIIQSALNIVQQVSEGEVY